MKICGKCKLSKNEKEFANNKNSIDKLQTYCRSCHKEYRRPRVKELTANKSKRLNEIKKEGMLEYGGKCSCCGEHREKFLTIDHINNNGACERRELNLIKRNKQKYTGKKFWAYLKTIGYPKDKYRLLCFNCNSGRALNGGICPHEEERNKI